LKQSLVRDGLGRIQGTVADYYFENEEVWEDFKEKDVRFPIHNQYKSSECITYNLNDVK
jgi:hypothetical protein